LKRTAVAPVKLAPLIVMTAPAGPLSGENEVIRGATVKVPVLVAVPPGVVTLIVPDVAVDGTVAAIWVDEFTVNDAVDPLNLTDVAPPKPDPVIVTVVGAPPVAGENPVMFGRTVNVLELVAVPTGVVTPIRPLVAPGGTVAVMRVGLSSVNEAASPLSVTEIAPVKLAPLTTTFDPMTPLVGLMPVIRGATVNVAALVAVPPGVVTEIGPVVAFDGTVVVICVGPMMVYDAVVPLNLTDDAPLKFVPEIVTASPVAPVVGVTPVIVGVKLTV
jgi:hypothetical protein